MQTIPILLISIFAILQDKTLHVVDEDIWDFLRYVGVLFIGLAGWQFVRMVSAIDRLDKSINTMNERNSIIETKLTEHEKDIKEIKSELHELRKQK